MVDIEISVPLENKEIQELLNRIQNRAPLMRRISIIMKEGVTDNFLQGGRPAWLPSARGGVPLTLTGHLRDSITEFSTGDIAGAGTNVPYAGIHNFGGRTRPHVIKPKKAKALRFGGRFYKSVKHPGSKIPQREFLKITESEWEEIHFTIDDHLTKSS